LGLEKPNSGLEPGESGSGLDSNETFQISRNLGLDIDGIVCLLDSQLWLQAVLWIRIMLMQIRIRLITLTRIRILILFNADPDPTFHLMQIWIRIQILASK
jgi:hypothetical protein